MGPFRADQVGSLLRPKGLSKARAEKNLEFQRKAIAEAVRQQEKIGLQAITDGEFSREWWHLDYMLQLEGVTAKANPGPKFGGTQEQPPIPHVTGKLKYGKPIMIDDFAFLKQATKNRTVPDAPGLWQLATFNPDDPRATAPGECTGCC